MAKATTSGRRKLVGKTKHERRKDKIARRYEAHEVMVARQGTRANRGAYRFPGSNNRKKV